MKRRLLIAGLVPVLGCVCLAAAAAIGFSPDPACARPTSGPAQPGASIRRVVSGGVKRCYHLYVPPGVEPDRPLPVVISLHGFAGSARDNRNMARWEELAVRDPFLVAYPEGSLFPLRWNTGPGTKLAVDDVQFIAGLIADLEQIATVDPARVYVAGFSNGATMAGQVACRLADRVAAVGVVSGLEPEPPGGCHPARPVALIGFMGAADPLAGLSTEPVWLWDLVMNVELEQVPPQPTTAEALAAWVERNGCAPTPEPLSSTGAVQAARYAGCRGGADVVWYTLADAGHGWPGGPSIPFLGQASPAVDASAVMWAFFKAHPLTAR